MKKKIFLIRKIQMIVLAVTLVIVLLAVGISSNPALNLYGNADAYTSELSEIDSSTHTSEELLQVSIRTFYTVDASTGLYASATNVGVNENEIITIQDGKELDAFSKLCIANPAFLTYSYQLIDHIDYSLATSAASNVSFVPIGYNSPFTGTFDGQGYEIRSLLLMQIKEIHNTEEYSSFTYYGMFSKNSGVIKNFGLIETDIVQNLSSAYILGMSPVIGLNDTDGVIENVYVIDTRNAEEGEAGIAANGGYVISGFCYENKGLMKNCYTEYNIVVNYQTQDYADFAEVVYMNKGTLENINFLDHSIVRKIIENDIEKYLFDSGLMNGIKIDVSKVLGNYAADADELNTVFGTEALHQAGWFTKNNYSTNLFGLTHPILRGLRQQGESFVFEIETVNEFLYIFELANENSFFASNAVTYLLLNDIDLTHVPAHKYFYNDSFGATITGKTNIKGSLLLKNGVSVTTPTIYGIQLQNYINYLGFECYGFIPLLEGEISNLNLYYSQEIKDFNVCDSQTRSKAIGLVSGYVEGGKIIKVHTYGNLNLTTNVSSNASFGRYFVGGGAGVLSRNASLNKVTTAGSIIGGTHASTYINQDVTGYVNGNSMGGIVGYTMSTVGNISTVLSAMNLTATTYTSNTNIPQAIGGIIGSGYTNIASGLANKGNISIIGNSLGTVYSAGVIGRHVGVSSYADGFHNQGDITYTFNQAKTAYISGVVNVDILTTTSGTLSPLGNGHFIGSGFSNAGNLNFINQANMSIAVADSLNIYSSGVSYLNTKNGFTAELKGVYNIPYKYNNQWKKDRGTISNMEIDISSLREFAPCVVSSGVNASEMVSLEQVYNLRNIDYIQSTDLYFSNVQYSGCLSGEYMNLLDIKNEGKIECILLKNASRPLQYETGKYKTFKLYGVFEEVSTGCQAEGIYNGGDITFYVGSNEVTTLNIYYDVYLSGICYANRNSFTSDTEYNSSNPLHNDYDKESVGSLNNVLNHGNITSNSFNLEQGILSTDGILKGSVRIAGITQINENILSSCFNLGNLTNCGYVATPTGNYSSNGLFSLESGGLVLINQGKYAQIRDSANNGTIRTINMSKETVWVNAAGIVVRNDVLESGQDYASVSNQHHLQLICFTINYGEVYAFNYTDKITSTAQDTHCNSAGIIGVGLCSLLNSVNYGNIYGSEATSGMFGVIAFYKFASEVSEATPVTIANGLNYGIIRAINTFVSEGASRDLTYAEVIQLSNSTPDFYTYGIAMYQQYVGAVISIVNYASTSGGTIAAPSAEYISIRFLINFTTTSKLIAAENAIPQNAVISNTLASTSYPDYFMGQQVTYAPLTNITDENGNIGVFSQKFIFRRAISGDESVLEDNDTDQYLADFFEFIAFSKINEQLLESIGWRTVAYLNGAESFAKDLTSLGVLLNLYQDKTEAGYNTLVEQALQTENWITNCDTSVLKEILDIILATQSTEQLKTIVKNLLIESPYSTTLSQSFKETILIKLTDAVHTEQVDLRNFLDSVLYPEVLAKIIGTSDENYIKIQALIQKNIDSLNQQQLLDLAVEYLNLMQDGNFDNLFTDTSLSNTREELIIKLLAPFNATAYQEMYEEILSLYGDELSYATSTELYNVLETLNSDDKKELYLNLLAQNAYESTEIEAVIQAAMKQLNITISNDNTSLIDGFTTQQTSANLGVRDTSIDANYNNFTYTTYNHNQISNLQLNNSYISLNTIDYTNTWNLIKDSKAIETYLNTNLETVASSLGENRKGLYALATEYNNTYQSNDEPSYRAGRYRVTSRTSNIKNRFIYTPDELVSNKTYYYGPYVNLYGDMWNHNTSQGDRSSASNGGGAKNIGLGLFDNSSAGSTAQVYVPVFISLDRALLEKKIAGTSNAKIYNFFRNNVYNGSASSYDQWVSTDIIFGSNYNLTDNLNILLKNSNAVGGYGYDFETVGNTTTVTEENQGISTPGGGTYTYNGTSYSWPTSKQTGTAYTRFCDWFNQNVLMTYCSASVITGIYYQQDQWENYGAFLTAKDNQGQGVVTTSFIDYAVKDLIQLDGVLTKGQEEGSTPALDEKNIINVLMQYILSTNEGTALVMNTIGDKVKTTFSQQDYSVIKTYLLGLQYSNEFIDAYLKKIVYNEKSYALISGYKKEDNTDYDLESYLKSFISDENYSTYEKLILLANENQMVFKDILAKFIYYYQESCSTEFFTWIEGADAEAVQNIYNNLQSLEEINLDSIAQIAGLMDYIEEYLDLTSKSFSWDSSKFIFSEDWVYELNPESYEGSNYSYALTTSNPASQTITFEVANDQSTTLTILGKGTGTINVNGITLALNESISNYEWTDLTSGIHTIQFTGSIHLYNIALANGVTTTESSDLSEVTYSGWTRQASDTTGYTYMMVPTSESSTISFTTASNSTARNTYIWAKTSSGTGTITINNSSQNITTTLERKGWTTTLSTNTSYTMSIVGNVQIFAIRIGGAVSNPGDLLFTTPEMETNVYTYTYNSYTTSFTFNGVTRFNDTFYLLPANENLNIKPMGNNSLLQYQARSTTGEITLNLKLNDSILETKILTTTVATFQSNPLTTANTYQLSANGLCVVSEIKVLSLVQEWIEINPTLLAVEEFIWAYGSQYGLNQTIGFLYGGKLYLEDNLIYSAGVPLWELFSDEAVEELLFLLACYDDQVLTKYIESCTDVDILINLIAELCGEESRFFTEVIRLAELGSLTDAEKLLFTSAYLGTDLLNAISSSLLTESIMVDILTHFEEEYQFILENNTMNNNRFIALMELVGYNLATDGYGIYALSSSKGILNGNFLPDNIELFDFDSSYEKLTENNESYYALTEEKNASWRGGTTENFNDISDSTSVNYAFYVSMKQLKLSIATNIFDIELIDVTGTGVLETNEELIDNDKKEVYFYIPENHLGLDKTYKINTDENYQLSFGANFSYNPNEYAEIDSYRSLDASMLNQVGDSLTTEIYVYAEDRTVKAQYTIYLILTGPLSLTLESMQIFDGESMVGVPPKLENNDPLHYDQTATLLASENGAMMLNIQTNNIPNSTDFSRLVSFTDSLTNPTYSYDIIAKKFSFDVKPLVSGSIYTGGVWSRGNVILNMSIDDSLPMGTQYLVITLTEDIVYSFKFEREVANGCEIKNVIFKNKTLVFDQNNELRSEILYGEIYLESDVIHNNKPVYLDEILLSSRATITMTYAYEVSLSTNLAIYTITFLVTSESGNYRDTYTHYLMEKDPFAEAKTNGIFNINNYNPANYVAIYMDGDYIDDIGLTEDGKISYSFEREDENQNERKPKFRFNYNLNNFYLESDKYIQDYLSVDANGSTSLLYSARARYYGFSLEFYESAEATSYTFALLYTITKESITRNYVSPSVTITKLKSEDAYLKKITFIQEAGKISDLATLASLNEITSTVGDNTYEKIKDGTVTANDVVVDLQGLNYNTDAAKNSHDYFIVGTVNNATLANYAPLFSIKSYAQLYQYLIVTNDDNVETKYLYIEFVRTDDSTLKEVFLVEADSYMSGSAANVYDANELWDYAYITSEETNRVYPLPLGQCINQAFTYNTISYQVSETSGTSSRNNTSLNMDYIGIPEDGYFWFVNYIIYAENIAITKNYHIAVLDLTNTIRFDITILDDSDTKMDISSLYLTILCYEAYTTNDGIHFLYDDQNIKTMNKSIGAFLTRFGDTNYYNLQVDDNIDSFSIQALPYSYYYFILDLPEGHGCTYEITTESKDNPNNQWLETYLEEGEEIRKSDGSYLPPASIVTQNISLTITIKNSTETLFPWGEKNIATLPVQAGKKG